MTVPVSCAIVGLGRWGQNLVSSIAGRDDIPLRFTRAVTRTPSKAKTFCDRLGLPLGFDLGTALADDDIDAVVLATPHSLHREQVVAAARAGKHVFVEKPLALSAEDARAMITACREADRRLAVGFNRRFLPAFRALQGVVANGGIGRPLLVEGQFSGPWGFGYSDDMWRGTTAENPAGGMAALGIHVLDAMIAVTGRVASVRAVSRRQVLSADIDDTTTAMLDFENGTLGTLSTLMASPTCWRLHVAGTKGCVTMPDQGTLDHLRPDGAQMRTSFPATDTLAEELRAFAHSILHEAPFPVSDDDALAGVIAMEAIARSAECDGAIVRNDPEIT